MKSALVLDQSCNPKNAPEYLRGSIQPVFQNGKVTDWIYPKGTVFEGEQALFLVSTGQAAPFDQECAAACGMSGAELTAKQRLYLSAQAGIKGENDQNLFMAEVIDGYLPGTTDAKPIYKPGKYWGKYQEALADSKKAEEQDE